MIFVALAKDELTSVVCVTHESLNVLADEVESFVTGVSSQRDHSEHKLQTKTPQHWSQLHLERRCVLNCYQSC